MKKRKEGNESSPFLQNVFGLQRVMYYYFTVPYVAVISLAVPFSFFWSTEIETTYNCYCKAAIVAVLAKCYKNVKKVFRFGTFFQTTEMSRQKMKDILPTHFDNITSRLYHFNRTETQKEPLKTTKILWKQKKVLTDFQGSLSSFLWSSRREADSPQRILCTHTHTPNNNHWSEDLLVYPVGARNYDNNNTQEIQGTRN